ncbi:MAG: hypothetical protein QJR08_04395 [Bacillota bacterium]|nr:hypothetical protein [Bacillota bacterium]
MDEEEQNLNEYVLAIVRMVDTDGFLLFLKTVNPAPGSHITWTLNGRHGGGKVIESAHIGFDARDNEPVYEVALLGGWVP